MDFMNFIADNQEEIAIKVNAAGAAWNQVAPSEYRHLHTVAEGYRSTFALLGKASNLEIVRSLLGQGLTPELIHRLHSLSLGDLARAGSGNSVDVCQLILQFCIEEEVNYLAIHGGNITGGFKALKNLLALQVNDLFQNLNSRPIDLDAQKYYHDTTDVEDLTNYVLTADVQYIGGGGYGDVYKTDLVRNGSVSWKVAVKTLRCYSLDLEDRGKRRRLERKIRKEIRVWKDLHHINIVPLLGLVHGFRGLPFPSMVCPWMQGGTLTMYLTNEREDLSLSDRFRLINDIMEGLAYLHAKPVIHGDLTHVNILISDNTARLSDFGLSEVISEFVGTSYLTGHSASSRDGGGAKRWAAPELFFRLTDDIYEIDRSRKISKACDIWSFGCIIQEVISGCIPYFNINESLVEIHKLEEILPARPDCMLLTDEIWNLIQRCWRSYPEDRPEIAQVSRGIQEIRSRYSVKDLSATLPPLLKENGTDSERRDEGTYSIDSSCTLTY